MFQSPCKNIVTFQNLSIHNFFGCYRRKTSSGAIPFFTAAPNEGWSVHLEACTAEGVWSIPKRKHINFLVIKVVLLALKEFEPLCKRQVVLVATDNTTMVAHINKEGYEIKVSLCPPVDS